MFVKDIIFLNSSLAAAIDLPDFFNKLILLLLMSSIYIKKFFITSALTHFL